MWTLFDKRKNSFKNFTVSIKFKNVSFLRYPNSRTDFLFAIQWAIFDLLYNAEKNTDHWLRFCFIRSALLCLPCRTFDDGTRMLLLLFDDEMEKFVNIGNDYIETKRAYKNRFELTLIEPRVYVWMLWIFGVAECNVTREKISF